MYGMYNINFKFCKTYNLMGIYQIVELNYGHKCLRLFQYFTYQQLYCLGIVQINIKIFLNKKVN